MGRSACLHQIAKYTGLRRSDGNTHLFFLEPHSNKFTVSPASSNLPASMPFNGRLNFFNAFDPPSLSAEFPNLECIDLFSFWTNPTPYSFAGKFLQQDYDQAKLQWTLMTKSQWHFSPGLKDTVHELEAEIESSSEVFDRFPSPQEARQCAFNVLFSFHVVGGFTDFGESRVKSLIPLLKLYGVSPSKEPEIFRNYGAIRCFFAQFLSLKDSTFPLSDVFQGLGDFLVKTNRSVIDFYATKFVDNLDFLIAECASLFVDCFDDVDRLWRAFLVSEDPPDFYVHFLAAFLVLMAPKLEPAYVASYGDFCAQFQVWKREIPLLHVLDVARRL
jgi:hypothetical protein